MKIDKKQVTATSLIDPSVTLGAFAHAVIAEQYRAVVKHEKKVIADKNPEPLHQMRVGTRRLRTALQVFDWAIALPKAAAAKQIGSLAKVLGRLRDLDVQIDALQTQYRSDVAETTQRSLDDVIAKLQKERRVASADVKDALTRSRYQQLKTAYETWIEQPRYTALASQPLQLFLPDLLSPLLSTLLLHPGWLVPADASDADSESLHDLRKACKHVRYQAEFFVSFYGEAFQTWIDDVKAIQSKLGTVHDSQVLQALLKKHQPKHTQLPELQTAIHQTQTEAMSGWEAVRLRYLEPAFRQQLRQLLLEPIAADMPTEQQLSK
ncbi:CHAD domain-containing protein [Leptolyngbya sp. FACHB-321]|uniref:CHAD domain-containing protein n=1 Tax=Leptolyngbya sp. FACHB-321 TaxID=2692807 RepID=UPI001686CCA4|nr:CHAD domain-containing protein [Leptolyngbya sp. FACHB-321]MBD2035368.1 CHAD domain-containing protein [Leptolyngbya sp. FACHB-321]